MMKLTTKDLVSTARTFLGKPYVWGGESDSEGGYDCSGFLYAVLKKCGMNVPRTTAQGFSQLGKVVGSIQSGDLLFFGKSKNNITHVAIAISSTQMIESIGTSKNTKNNKGKGVTISSINRRSDLVLIKRIVTYEREGNTKMQMLKKGTHCNDVTVFEILMQKNRLYGGSIDTSYGNGCVTACKTFQKSRGLAVDGICGNNTWKKLLESVY